MQTFSNLYSCIRRLGAQAAFQFFWQFHYTIFCQFLRGCSSHIFDLPFHQHSVAPRHQRRPHKILLLGLISSSEDVGTLLFWFKSLSWSQFKHSVMMFSVKMPVILNIKCSSSTTTWLSSMLRSGFLSQQELSSEWDNIGNFCWGSCKWWYFVGRVVFSQLPLVSFMHFAPCVGN